MNETCIVRLGRINLNNIWHKYAVKVVAKYGPKKEDFVSNSL